jgi:catechol 2,3-dioxygenase-like lactoylglutathione lyase family enzyme
LLYPLPLGLLGLWGLLVQVGGQVPGSLIPFPRRFALIDHVALNVSDLARSKSFYLAALGPLGYQVVSEGPNWAGLGVEGNADLWLGEGTPAPGVHLALGVGKRELVDAFHAAALEAGALDNGGPGLRPQYHSHYYAAYVIDPDGVNLEVVCTRS